MDERGALSRTRFWAAVLVAGAAVLLALFLRWETARHEATGAASSCTISDTVDCDKVQASPYAKVFGVSLSAWGAAGVLIVLLWTLQGALRAAGLLALLNLLASLFYLYVSIFEIGAVCLYCSGMQLLNLVLAVLLVPPALRARTPLRAGPVLVGALTGVLVLGLAGAGDAYATRRSQLVRLYDQPEGATLRVDVSDAILLGDPETRLSILLYFDFGCPVCRDCYHKARYLLQKYPKDVHFIFKHWPLDKQCNDTLQGTTHAGSCRAARAGQAAALKGGSDRALMYLFDLDSFYPKLLDKLGTQVGASEDEWAKLQESERVTGLVDRDVLEGNVLGFRGVPKIYINGHPADPGGLVQRVERLIGR